MVPRSNQTRTNVVVDGCRSLMEQDITKRIAVRTFITTTFGVVRPTPIPGSIETIALELAG